MVFLNSNTGVRWYTGIVLLIILVRVGGRPDVGKLTTLNAPQSVEWTPAKVESPKLGGLSSTSDRPVVSLESGNVYMKTEAERKLDLETTASDVGGGAHGGEHGEHEVKRMHVMTIEFARVETPFIIGLWIFFASIAKIGFHMAPKLSNIFPESCLLIVVGVVIGVLLFHTTSVQVSTLTPDTFFLYMLPPIILDAGYFMPNRLFFDHLGTILLFAVVGTIFNTCTIGTSLYFIGQTGLFGCETPLLEMFLFSALISAVDPVAVLAVFEEIHVNEILYIVVFGESLLNDAVTVVLYHMFEAYSEMGIENIIYTDVLAGFASFWVVALGGTIIGIFWGFLTGFVTRYTHQVRVIEPIFIFVMAYLAYLNAEIFHMSGILAITFCGITMKNYVEANISHKSHTTVKYAMKMLSSSSETIIFMFLGVATVNDSHHWNTWFVVLTITFCSVYRTIGVIILTALANKFRLHKLNKVEKFVMSYGGLRGAVAFALVLLINPLHVKLQPMFVTTTIAVVYFTVFFQGITIRPLVKILNVKRAEKRKPTMNERIHERLMDHMMAGIEDILGRHGDHHVRDKFKRFDNKFIRPLLLRDAKGAEPKILETYSKLAMKDAMEYMRRNASTIGNISGTESMSAIFRNYTAGTFNNGPGQNGNFNTQINGSHLDSSTWNIDMQELEYNPSKKDLTDAKIHHLLAEELCKPYRRHRRLSYSRHAVDDRDLSTQVNYRMHMNIRRMVGERKHHSKRSKRLNKVNDDNDIDDLEDLEEITAHALSLTASSLLFCPPAIMVIGPDGKQNHVSFNGITQNGSAKQFSHDYINEVLNEDDGIDGIGRDGKDEWEGGITFTAKTPNEDDDDVTGSLLTHIANLPGFNPRKARLVKQYSKNNVNNHDDEPTVAEVSLPWRRGGGAVDEMSASGSSNEMTKKLSRESDGGEFLYHEVARVTTPTATETMLPWKRNDEDDMATDPIIQSEFPAWCSNKEYLAYNSPSATFLGGIEQPKHAPVRGLFRRESSSSAHDSHDSHRSSISSLHDAQQHQRVDSPPGGNGTILLIEEPVTEPLGLGLMGAGVGGATNARRPLSGRRGSLLELGTTPIPEEDPFNTGGSSPPLSDLWKGPGTRLMTLNSSSSSSTSSLDGEEAEKKAMQPHKRKPK